MIEVILRKHDSLEARHGRFDFGFSISDEVAEAAFRNEPDFPQIRVERARFFSLPDEVTSVHLEKARYDDWREDVRVYLQAKVALLASELLKATLSKLEQMDFAATKVER